MAQPVQLTNGAIRAIYNTHQSITDLEPAYANPVVQIFDMKRVGDARQQQGPGAQGRNQPSRVRASISDGTYMTTFAMLATQLQHRYNKGEINNYSIFRIKKFSCNPHPTDQTKRVCIILDIEMLQSGTEIGHQLGNPLVVNPDGSIQPRAGNATTTPAPPPPQAAAAELNQPAAKRVNQGAPPAPLQPIAPRHQYGQQQSAPSYPPPAASAYGVPQPQSAAPMSTAGGREPNVHPIESLTPYQNRWTIKARVLNKGTPRSFTSKQGKDGKVFSMTLGDSSGEIRATLFGQEVDRWIEVLVQGKVFYISNARLKPANKQYSQGIDNDYEMTFSSDTTVVQAADDVSVPDVKFKFVPIEQLADLDVNTFVDVIGIVKTAGDAQHILSKAQKELVKRDVELVEQSGQSVTFTMWGDQAQAFDASLTLGRVLAVKGARVSEFQGKTLNSGFASTIVTDPAVPEAAQLRTWYDTGGSNQPSNCISRGAGGGNFSAAAAAQPWKTLANVEEEKLGYGDRPDYFTNMFYITSINKDRMVYESCPNEGCKKKVMQVGAGVYRCEKCNQDVVNVNYRLIPSMQIADATSSTFMTAFEDQAVELLGKTGAEIGFLMKDSNSQGEIEKIVSDLLFSQHIMRLRVKLDTWNDESRLKYTLAGLLPMSEADIAKKLTTDLRSMNVSI